MLTPTPELTALRDVCARLDGAGITYMLTGSLAMSFYARPRMTRDIDLVVTLDAANMKQFVEALGADFHADASAIAVAFGDRRPWNIIHVPSVATSRYCLKRRMTGRTLTSGPRISAWPDC